jgi:phage gp29-like protein
MTKDDKLSEMMRVMGSRRGRRAAREKMKNPFMAMVDPWEECHLCALRELDCETIVAKADGRTCRVPIGTIYVWGEEPCRRG